LFRALQNVGTWAAGGLGGGFGYAGIGNSVAICLDTYSGTSPNYIATQAWTNGNIQQISAFRVGTPITDGRVYVSRKLFATRTSYSSPGSLVRPPRRFAFLLARALQTFTWTYRRATQVATWTISGNGYSETFTQIIGDIPSIVGASRAFIGFGA
jgi:hypothetical protein